MICKMFRLLAILAIMLTGPRPSLGAPPNQGERYAFLVSCASYDTSQFAEMSHNIYDMQAFRQALLTTGFKDDHIQLFNDHGDKPFRPEKAILLEQFDRLLTNVKDEDTVIVALAGHGLHFKGGKTDYFCPINADINEKKSLLNMGGEDGFLRQLSLCKAKKKLLIVDACRNNPFADSVPESKRTLFDDADVEQTPEGIVAIYSCSAGQKSYVDPRHNSGIFFKHLIRAWYGEYVQPKQRQTLSNILEQVKLQTKLEVALDKTASQVPLVRCAVEADWTIQTIYAGEAFFQHGERFYTGLGEKINLSKAVDNYKEAAKLNHPFAKGRLAEFYFEGRWLFKDTKEAARLTKEISSDIQIQASRCLTTAQGILAFMTLNGLSVDKNPREAANWYRRAGERNDATYQTEYGKMLAHGLGVEKDEKEAIKWYRKASEQNLAMAQKSLGWMYAHGFGVAKDEMESVKWFLKAAEQNDPVAQSDLGIMYFQGRGVKKDEKEAVRWLRKSAEQNHAIAEHQLGIMYHQGYGVKKDEKEAIKWLHKAAEQNLAMSQNSLGLMYASGFGVEKDEKEAVKWFQKAAEQNFAKGQRSLGWMYAHGYGVEKDEKEAIKWIRKAAEQNDPTAQNDLGIIYLQGRGVEKDEKEALKWFRKAAEQGNIAAKQYLRRLSKEL